MKKLFFIFALLLSFLSTAHAVWGFPSFPMSIWGTLKDGQTNIPAWAVVKFLDSNNTVLLQYTTTKDGQFGGVGATEITPTLQSFTGNLSMQVVYLGNTFNIGVDNIDDTNRWANCPVKSAITFISAVCRYDISIVTPVVPISTTPISSWGGGGGWGWWASVSIDSCPNGDNSGSNTDGKCTWSGVSVVTSWENVVNDNTIPEKIIHKNIPKKKTTSNLPKTTSELLFTDIQNNWAYDYIVKLSLKWVVNNSEKFNPNNNTTRAEFLKMIIGTIGGDITNISKTTPFSDVSELSWYAPYIAYAVKNNLINATLQTFRPNDTITREEAMKILTLSLKLDTSKFTSTSFSDVTVDSWFVKYIEAAKEQHIISGQVVDNKLIFRPKDNITRAEISKILASQIK